ncbi:MAG: FadR family transcriptional regulator [Chloroflexi bacterium]|nr:FadR family transcriptional regulator [Chloroflexota bacterium]
MGSRYQPLERTPRLSDRVGLQIEQLISESELQPGDRLPAERELGDAFGVSRTVVREAVRALVAKGLVEVRPGGGTVVRQPSAAIVSDALTFLLKSAPGGAALGHLREARRVLEPALAELAAARRTDDDIRAMEHELLRMRDPKTSAEDWAHADVQFHAAIARATHNPIFGIILHSIQDLLLEVRLIAVELPETRQKGSSHHEHVLKAIREGNTSAARRAMSIHLREAEMTQLKATTGVATPRVRTIRRYARRA